MFVKFVFYYIKERERKEEREKKERERERSLVQSKELNRRKALTDYVT